MTTLSRFKKAYGLRCKCGHLADDHVRLPGHPDGAEECWGADECECGRFISARFGNEKA